MSKISKFIICCIAVIISIVSLCVPTYCADISSSLFTIDLVNEFPNYNNYYNTNNIKYITYKNFYIYRTKGLCFYSKNIDALPSSFYTGQIFNDNYTTTIGEYSLNITSSYTLNINSDNFTLDCDSFYVDGLQNLELNMSPSEISYIFSFHWVPFDFLSYLNGNFVDLHVYGAFVYEYDIDYNGQYFYNDTFCFTSNLYLTNGIVNTLPDLVGTNLCKVYGFTDNYNDIYTSRIYPGDSFKGRFVQFNNLLYTDRYITNVYCWLNNNNIRIGDITNLYRLYSCYDLKYVDYDSIDSINLFSGNSTGSGGAVGSLIPNGSNNFYKTAEWWDIPSHLYNFFIYLIFDAPIISNFTNLVMVIINFIVEVFDFIIGLFSGINNIFFVSIFVGIIVLIFLLKIIFKG